jgi:hypothetical protein
VRNYWTLLPAIAVCVVLALVYAVPTLINPQITRNVVGLFRSDQDAARAALGRKQVFARRMAAVAALVGAVGLVGFNVSLNREANGCYLAAKAWGSDGSKQYDDPCMDMLVGTFFGSDGKATEDSPQPVKYYQLVKGKKPHYLRWIAGRPSYDVDLLVGVPSKCAIDLQIEEGKAQIVVVLDATEPCPSDSKITLGSIELKEPLGDRKIVTVGDKPMEQINPEMESWGKVLKGLVTGG